MMTIDELIAYVQVDPMADEKVNAALIAALHVAQEAAEGGYGRKVQVDKRVVKLNEALAKAEWK